MTGEREGKPKALRSAAWFNDVERPDQTAIYVERLLNYGLTREELQVGRPIIGIAQTGNDLTPCNRHHIELAKRVRDGIRDAGGIPMEFPVHPIAEQGRRPTAALDRNLAWLALIETLHGYPIDGVVLTTGCDKTTPACLMAVAALDMPAIVLSGGPMLNGWSGPDRVGSGSIIWRSREQFARGEIDFEGFMENLTASSPSAGHCNTMGTALSMNAMAEAMGMSLPGCASIPATYQERGQMAYRTGLRAVEIVREDLRPSRIMTRDAFINGIVAVSAIGGSSNVPVHHLAIARQLPDLSIGLEDWQEHGEAVPLIVNCQPAGSYLGEDFHRAGGVPAVMGELIAAGLIRTDAITVNGRTIGENFASIRSSATDVIRPASHALRTNAGFAVMRGNFFDSAILKKSVIDDEFRAQYLLDPARPGCFDARAVVFEGPEDYHSRINDPALNIDRNCILVIRNCGPVGYPGSGEVVNMLPPDRLVAQGVTTLPCLGDGRQSGTSASPSILNMSPEAAAGGGLALLEDGDVLRIDLVENRVDLLIKDASLAERRARFSPPALVNQTPWQEIYRTTVSQLGDGATMTLSGDHRDILRKHRVPRHSH